MESSLYNDCHDLGSPFKPTNKKYTDKFLKPPSSVFLAI